MNINQFKIIYYRGFLRSCNYHCWYCPFSKNKTSNSEINKDMECLNKFAGFLEERTLPVTLFFVPYGEALIHDYYLKTIAELSNRSFISNICIQTNNSFNLDKLMGYVNEYHGNIKKIMLWCSYHPTQVLLDTFLNQCMALYEAGILFSVGGVADYGEINKLSLLRERLPSDVYMWLNRMDVRRHMESIEYKTHEINEFLNIDPFFELQLMSHKSDIDKCGAGRDGIFVDYKGDMYPCNVNRCKIGNIYGDAESKLDCTSPYCNCYMAFSNRNDLPLLNVFSVPKQLRIIKRNDKQIYFLDVDGTIVSSDGKITDENIEIIKNLSLAGYIFLNTALPFHLAYLRCKRVWDYIHGGVFSNGSDLRIFEYKYKRIIPMDPVILTLLNDNNIRLFPSYDKAALHKVLVRYNRKSIKNILSKEGTRYNISYDKSSVIITDISASKLKGALFICRFFNISHDNVMVAGNSENDDEMLSYFKNSILL